MKKRAQRLCDMMRSKRDCPYANVITRALGLAERAEPDCAPSISTRRRFLLCSDGLSDPLPEEKLAELLRGAAASDKNALKDTTEALIRAAYDAGGRDNISAIVVRVL